MSCSYHKTQNASSSFISSLSGERSILSLYSQVKRLREIFTGLRATGIALRYKQSGVLPLGTEGLFAIPNWKMRSDLFGETYEDAVRVMLCQLGNHFDGPFVYGIPESRIKHRLHRKARSSEYFAMQDIDQDHEDILLIPAQCTTLHHAGCITQQDVEEQIAVTHEYGLGVFEVACILLTHPRYLPRGRINKIGCIGDEYEEESYWTEVGVPHFVSIHGSLEFGYSSYYDTSKSGYATTGMIMEDR